VIRALLVAVAAQWTVVSPLFAEPPSVTRSIPGAVTPGRPTEVTFIGERLSGDPQLWTTFAARTTPIAGTGDTERAVFRLAVPPDAKAGIGAARLVTTNGVSGWHFLMVDDLSSVTDNGTNKSMALAQELKLPAGVDGLCEPLSSDFYKFTAKKGKRLSVEVVAQRLGSALDPIVRLLDAAGRELESIEDTPGAGADVRFRYRFAATGTYFLEIRDTIYEGGPKHRYRLRIGDFALAQLPFLTDAGQWPQIEMSPPAPQLIEREPNDRPGQALNVEVPSLVAGRFHKVLDRDYYEVNVTNGQRLVIRGRTRSLGSPCDLFLQLQSANGTKVAEANVNGSDEGALTNTFSKAGAYRLLVEELNRGGGPDFNYRLSIEPLTPGFALSVETDRVSTPPGSDFEIQVSAVRREYDGPIQLSLAGLGEGFALSNAVIRAKTNEVKLKVTVPDDIELGQLFPFAILGQAEISGATFKTRTSTMPALRSQFPEMLWPPEELDGWIALSIATSKSPATDSRPKRKRK
jgi:hypothetical protein